MSRSWSDPRAVPKVPGPADRGHPELFPPEIQRGYRMKDLYTSRKTGWKLRRIELRNDQCYLVRPSFLMPYLSGRTEDVQAPLFSASSPSLLGPDRGLRPLAHVLAPPGVLAGPVQPGRHDRPGRRSGCPATWSPTRSTPPWPARRSTWRPPPAADAAWGWPWPRRPADDLTSAYGVFRDEARRLDPKYRPETVNTDGWPATQAAWRALFKGVTLILCFLHAFLKIRDRAVHLKETFDALRERVWEAYHAPDARSFSQRLRRLREWAGAIVDKEVVREKVLALCGKRAAFVRAYAHPGCHRTSNLVDRLLRRLDYHLYCGQHLHGTGGGRRAGAAGLGVDPQLRPVVPWTVRESPGLAEPGRAAQREAVSPRVAPEPAGLGVTRRLSQASPKSVTSRSFVSMDSRSSSRRPGMRRPGSASHGGEI